MRILITGASGFLGSALRGHWDRHEVFTLGRGGRSDFQWAPTDGDMDATALERVETAGAETLFCGHTHQPYVRELSGGSIRVSVQQRDNAPASEQEMTLPMRRIVNAGSVGEPRHGNTKATYVIHDDRTGEVSIREVDYDVAKTCRAILEAGLPEVFAWRLSHGFEYAERAEDASHVCER